MSEFKTRTVYVVEHVGGNDRNVRRSDPFDTWDDAVAFAQQFRFPQAVIRKLMVHPKGFLVDPGEL